MKLEAKRIKSNIKSKCLDALYAAFGFAEEKNATKSFLNDVLTESEKIMIGRRILVAKKLLVGQSYREITREMGVGLDTVYKVKKWLGGRHKGIEKVVDKVKRSVGYISKNKSEFRDYYQTSGLAEIRRRYKSYYWLSNLLDDINKN